jgi:hypothetical protein
MCRAFCHAAGMICEGQKKARWLAGHKTRLTRGSRPVSYFGIYAADANAVSVRFEQMRQRLQGLPDRVYAMDVRRTKAAKRFQSTSATRRAG